MLGLKTKGYYQDLNSLFSILIFIFYHLIIHLSHRQLKFERLSSSDEQETQPTFLCYVINAQEMFIFTYL